jgi:hypothetical protein
MKLIAQNFVKMKDNTVWHNKQNVQSHNENHITYQNITETKHTNCRPLNIKTVSYYENH